MPPLKRLIAIFAEDTLKIARDRHDRDLKVDKDLLSRIQVLTEVLMNEGTLK